MMGHAKASELLLFGEPFDAQYADKVGIVSQVVTDFADDNSVVEFAKQRAQVLAKLPIESLLTSKKLIKQANAEHVHQVMLNEIEQFDRLLRSDTCKARIAATLG